MTQTFAKPNWQLAQGKRTLYTHARLIDPASGLDTQGALLTEGNNIADFGEHLRAEDIKGAEVIDCKGNVLCPGLIDIQVHFREPGQEYKESIESGSKSAAAGGVTMVACMPNTEPTLDDPAMIDFVHARARETAYVNVRTYGCISRGMKGKDLTEMGLMVDAGAVGFTDDGLPVMNAQLMRQALTYGKELGVPIAQHAEDLDLSNHGCINEGTVSAQLGVGGIPNASEAAIVARDIILAELTGAHYHVLHISTAEAIEAVRQGKKRGVNVTCEAAPHHFTLNDSAVGEYDTFAKMNPPLRSEKDRLAIIEGLKDGTVDAIATDHAPHDKESKDIPLSCAAFGIVGLETMLPLSLKLYHEGHLSLQEVLKTLTCQPADIIHMKTGQLKKGYPADLTVIDIDHEWSIDPTQFHSKSKNSPFRHYPAKGRAMMTMVQGNIVYTY